MNVITHRTQAGIARYDARGITLRPRFGSARLHIGWNNIDFLSPTPGLRLTDTGWTDFRGNPVEQLSRLLIEPALFDRHVFRGAGWWERRWLRRFEPGVLRGADDRPLPKAGFFRIEVRLATLSVPRAVFFDYLTTQSRFDLIAHL